MMLFLPRMKFNNTSSSGELNLNNLLNLLIQNDSLQTNNTASFNNGDFAVNLFCTPTFDTDVFDTPMTQRKLTF